MNTRKVTKTQFMEALNAFRYTFDCVTGGTIDETRRQAPHAINDLERKADVVVSMLGNLNKAAMNCGYYLEYAASIPERLASYRMRYLAQ